MPKYNSSGDLTRICLKCTHEFDPDDCEMDSERIYYLCPQCGSKYTRLREDLEQFGRVMEAKE